LKPQISQMDTDLKMKITALAPWFGGKRNLSEEIVKLIGPHKTYWEPFCGSMAILLAKEPCAMETVNDLHGDLINLARILQAEASAVDLYDRLSRTLMCEDIYLQAAQRYKTRGYYAPIDRPDIDRAYDYFIYSWLGRNGTSGEKASTWNFCVRYTSNGGHAATRFHSATASIPMWHKRLRNVTILHRDAFEILSRIEDKENTVIYVDPPYFVKGSKYIHDFAANDHARLAVELNRFHQSRVVLSYYDHDLLNTYYPAWTRHAIDVTKSMAHGGKRGTCNLQATEILLVNDMNKRQQRLF
jgi:DNA adenine methylase